jgi:hypothetical protein
MSAPIVLQPNLVQIKAYYTPNPDTAEHPMNLLWFISRSAGGPFSLAGLQAVATAFDPLWGAIWRYFGNGHRFYIGSTVTDYSTAFGLQYDSRGVFTPQAGATSQDMPPNVAALISLHVAERWKGGHFRIYLPWGGQTALDSNDSNHLSASTIGNMTVAYAALEPGMNSIAVAGGFTQRCYRQRTDPVKAHLMPINTFTVQQLVATQRRRLRKAPHH